MSALGDGRYAQGDDTGEWAAPFLPADDAPPGASGGHGGGKPPSGEAIGEARVAWYVPLIGRLLMLFAAAMIVGAIFAGLSGVGVPARDTPTYTLALTTANPTIEIENAVGSVRVIPNVDPTVNEVKVVQSIAVRHLSSALARRSLDAARIAAPTVGNDGVVRVISQPRFDWGFFFQREVDLVVYVPASAAIRLNVTAGTATVERTSGRLDVTVNGGNLDLLHVKLDDGSRLAVNAGNARLDGELLPDASLTVEVNAGNATITLPYYTDARLRATVDGGNLGISGWSGLADTSPSQYNQGRSVPLTGGLYTDPNPKSQITIVVNSGNVTLRPR